MIQGPEVLRADQLRPNPFFPQRKLYPLHMLADLREYRLIRSMRLAMYSTSLTLAANKTGRTMISVDPGFTLTMISGQNTAANPADGLGASQIIIFDPARRLRFSRIPIVSNNLFGQVGAGQMPFLLRTPYTWRGGEKAPIQIQIQNRANAANIVSILLLGRDPQ